MIKRLFGNTGISVPIIGQGSWQFPSDHEAVENTKEALLVGIEHGMVHIDTAEMYGDSELIIGAAIKTLPRKELYLVSKVLPENATYEGTIEACERSLQRLGTDYLDSYLLHWRGSHPLSQTMAALEALVDAGKILSLGVSNFDTDDLEEATGYLNKHKIACNQVLYNLYERRIERKVIPYCQSKNIAVVGYTPFAQRNVPPPNTKSGAVFHEITKKYNAKPHQIILAFLVRMDGLFTIPKASHERHTLENARAGDISFSEEDIRRLDEAFPAPAKDSPLAMI